MASNASLVFPPKPLVPESIPLSPLDQHTVRAYVARFVICFPLSGGTTPAELFKTLQVSLSNTISALPLIAGHINPAAAGHVALKIEAGSGVELRYKDLTKPGNSLPGYESYQQLKKDNFPLEKLPESVVSPVGLLPDNFEDAPAIIAQCNFLPGGMLLCVAFHHSIFDARASGMIITRWAEERRWLSEPNGTMPKPVPAEATDRITPFLTRTNFDPLLGEDFTLLPPPPNAEPVKQAARTMHFSSTALLKLKGLVNSKASEMSWISTNDALSALLFHSVTRARHSQSVASSKEQIRGPDEEERIFACAVDSRARMSPPNPQYLGNASFFRLTPLRHTHLLRHPLASDEAARDQTIPLVHTARAIRERVKRVDQEYFENVSALYASTPVTTPIRQPVMPGKYFMTSYLVETGVGTADWGEGLGKADAVRLPAMLGDGYAYAMPRAGEKGGLDVVLWMDEAVMGRVLEELKGWVDVPIPYDARPRRSKL